jgi:hypothetical protein
VLDPKPYKDANILRYNTSFFTSPADVAGTSYLNVWNYDATQFPDLHGFIPAFKRIRRFPTTQRFEPMVPGTTFYMSDAWMMGDPYLTWGNYKIVKKQPMLANVNGNWNGADANWKKQNVGGANGERFFRSTVELVPEAVVVEMDPTRYPRSPYGKKWIWFDTRNVGPLVHVTFDRRGQMWKQWEGGFDMYEDAKGNAALEPNGKPMWSWVFVHSHDIQSDNISKLQLVKSLAGGYQTKMNDPTLYESYCTPQAIQQLGA